MLGVVIKHIVMVIFLIVSAELQILHKKKNDAEVKITAENYVFSEQKYFKNGNFFSD